LASHVIGVYDDILWQRLIARAQEVGALVIGDASQYVGHRALLPAHKACDALVVSAHKMMGPTGIGAVRILRKHHARLTPVIYGGGMVQDATRHGDSVWQKMPYLLEAGTPPMAQAYAWAQVVEWQAQQYTLDQLAAHEAALIAQLVDGLQAIPNIHIIVPPAAPGTSRAYSHLISFYHATIHAHDIAHALGQQNICVRAGSLCAQPAMEQLGVSAVVRASLHAYTHEQDIIALIKAVQKLCA
jgi:cysteine desulfurase/selenocysteine lyase